MSAESAGYDHALWWGYKQLLIMHTASYLVFAFVLKRIMSCNRQHKNTSSYTIHHFCKILNPPALH